jgi:hypothetical protein
MAPMPAIHKVASLWKLEHWDGAKRFIPESTLISIIIPLVILCIFAVSVAGFFVRKMYTQRLEARKADEEAPTPPPLAERPSNWARQNSNVLWSMYINDDDLRAQFSKPSKDSRLFSVGSVSTIGPMDLPATRPGIVVEHDERPAALNQMEGMEDHKDQDGFVSAKTTGRRSTFANTLTQSVKLGGLAERMERRNMSLTTC